MYSRSCPNWKQKKEILALKVKENISFKEARKRFFFVQHTTCAEVACQGAAPARPKVAAKTTSRDLVVPPPAAWWE